MLDKNKLYYLSHPYTTYGDPKQNISTAKVIAFALDLTLGIKIVNPIVILPSLTDAEAMEKCKHLYNACDVLILCEGWEWSMGCIEEYRWALADGKPIYLVKKSEGNKHDYVLKEYKTA